MILFIRNSKNIRSNYIISKFCFIINIIVSLYVSLKFFFVKWYILLVVQARKLNFGACYRFKSLAAYLDTCISPSRCQPGSRINPDVSGEHKYRRGQRPRRWWVDGDETAGTGERRGKSWRRKSLERTKARGWHDESRVDVSFPANSRTMHTN